jgi:hypothetical protein
MLETTFSFQSYRKLVYALTRTKFFSPSSIQLSIVQITDPSPTRAVVVKGSIPSYSPAHYNSSSSANNSNTMAHYTATTTSSARRYSPASSPRHIARNSREFTIGQVKNPQNIVLASYWSANYPGLPSSV